MITFWVFQSFFSKKPEISINFQFFKVNVGVSALSNLLSVTEETIRRDLESLEEEGLLKRTYGGAIPINKISLELPFKARKIEHREEKKAIGKVAAELIEDGDALMFDASTTVLEVVKQIGAKKD